MRVSPVAADVAPVVAAPELVVVPVPAAVVLGLELELDGFLDELLHAARLAISASDETPAITRFALDAALATPVRRLQEINIQPPD